MTTNQKVKAQFSIPELQDKKIVEWNLHVTKDMNNYDMIIGRDIMSFLKIDVLFSNQTIEWDDYSMPFKPANATLVHYHIEESMAISESTDRVREILDAKYIPADMEKVSQAQEHLTSDERQDLKTLLEKFEDLFDGTLGKWTEEPVKIELKPGVEPYHARPYPIPKVHSETLKMEVSKLVELGVLKKVNGSEWAAPSFIISKKDGTVRFINDFRELNKRIKRKPFPIPHIQDMLLNLEGFQTLPVWTSTWDSTILS